MEPVELATLEGEPVKDRHLLFGGLSALLLGLLGLVLATSLLWSPATNDPGQSSTNIQVPKPWEGQATGQVKEFKLTVSRVRWELAPGRFVEAYAYNGQVPGPELRVTEGDIVRVLVTNELTEPTTIHWHGVEVPVEMDGAPELSQKPIAPGGTFTYQFVATPAGTRWYHSHFNVGVQQAEGLALVDYHIAHETFGL